MNKKAPLVFIVLLLFLLGPSLVLSEGEQASDSGQFHGDERHNGFIASVGPTSALLAWKIKQKCDGMIASNGRLIIVDKNNIHILNETGGVKLGDVLAGWCDMRTRYPVIGAGTIFASYYPQGWYWISAINLFSLELKWTKGTDWAIYPSGFNSIQVPYNIFLLAYSKG
jgi:hypothetical protein